MLEYSQGKSGNEENFKAQVGNNPGCEDES